MSLQELAAAVAVLPPTELEAFTQMITVVKHVTSARVLPPTELEAFTQWFEEYLAGVSDPAVHGDAPLTDA